MRRKSVKQNSLCVFFSLSKGTSFIFISYLNCDFYCGMNHWSTRLAQKLLNPSFFTALTFSQLHHMHHHHKCLNVILYNLKPPGFSLLLTSRSSTRTFDIFSFKIGHLSFLLQRPHHTYPHPHPGRFDQICAHFLKTFQSLKNRLCKYFHSFDVWSRPFSASTSPR